MSDRLTKELSLLYAAEARFRVPAAPIARQLVADEQRGLPDVLPRVPEWVTFSWPISGSVNLEDYWRQVDRARGARWMGPYL